MPVTFYATLDATTLTAGTLAYIPATAVLLPASSWAGLWRRDRRKAQKRAGTNTYARTQLPLPALPPALDYAVDPGGYLMTLVYRQYLYTPRELVTWCQALTPAPQWVATPDRCCEPELIAADAGKIALRQAWTTRMAWHCWRTYRAGAWAWVPTVQGWAVSDYIRHATELAPLIAEMAAYYGPGSAFRVGIGTLCRRLSTSAIRAVVSAVAAILPGIPLHLWGVKLGTLQDRVQLPVSVVSVDSAAWNGNQQIVRAVWQATGQTRRRYVLTAPTAGLRGYLAKVAAAQTNPKQMEMAL